MNKDAPVYVAGHRGLVGSAIVRRLEAEGFHHLILRPHRELDLTDRAAVERFFEAERPAYVFLAAAKVGGILANDSYPADFIRENLAIQLNVIEAARRIGVKKLLFLGSSCIYPKHAPQPIREDYLLTGPLEPTNDAYAVAKIAGIKMCQAYNRQHGTDFVCAMPTNLYGPGDNFDLRTSHVLPALIRRFHEARQSGAPEVVLWGTGTVYREFLHVDDLADACVFLMRGAGAAELRERFGSEVVNVGTGEDVTIREVAELVREVVGYEGEIAWDSGKPDGTPRKLLDVTRARTLGWAARVPLVEGIRATYAWYVEHVAATPRVPSTRPL